MEAISDRKSRFAATGSRDQDFPVNMQGQKRHERNQRHHTIEKNLPGDEQGRIAEIEPLQDQAVNAHEKAAATVNKSPAGDSFRMKCPLNTTNATPASAMTDPASKVFRTFSFR